MAYDITAWKTKSIEDLKVPLMAFKYDDELVRRGWKTAFNLYIDGDDMAITVNLGTAGFGVKGTLDPIAKLLQVTSIDIHGEGSGTCYEDLLHPALKESTGKLEAVIIWADGDFISKLSVNDGDVTENEYEF